MTRPSSDRIRDLLRARGAPAHVIEAGLQGLVDAWDRLAGEVEAGYSGGLDEYLNDVDARQILAEILEAAPEADAASLEVRLARADARFRRHATPVPRCLWGDRAASRHGWNAVDHWWYFSVPSRPGPQLSADLART